MFICGGLAALPMSKGRDRSRKSWSSMKRRCLNPKAHNYRFYGAKGIKICKRWLNSFENFFEDMGERPKGLSLDRIRSRGNYTPDNCRWSTKKVQGSNADNWGKGYKRYRTHCLRGHSYSGSNLRLTKSGTRRCYTCDETLRRLRERRDYL